MKRHYEKRKELLATFDISDLDLEELKAVKRILIRQQRYDDAAKLRDIEKILSMNINDHLKT